MDPLLVEALRFGVAIIAGGLVGVITAVVSFRYAQRLRREDDERRDEALQRALLAEIEENLRRIGTGATAPGSVSRSAWDAARSIDWPKHVLDLLAEAYADGDRLNSWVAMTDAHFAAPFGADEKAHREQQQLLSEFSGKMAEGARASFLAAQKALADL